MKNIKLFLILFMTFYLNQTFACKNKDNGKDNCQEITFKKCEVMDVKISNSYNIFSVKDFGINSIIGDTSKFEVKSLNNFQGEKKLIFIPKFSGGKLISVIFGNGELQKLKLTTSEIPPQEIVLNFSHDSLLEEKENDTDKAIHFLSRVLSGYEQYEPQNSSNVDLIDTVNKKSLNLTLGHNGYFANCDFIADSYTVKNKSECDVRLSDAVLAIDKNNLGFFCESKILKRNKSYEVVIVKWR